VFLSIPFSEGIIFGKRGVKKITKASIKNGFLSWTKRKNDWLKNIFFGIESKKMFSTK